MIAAFAVLAMIVPAFSQASGGERESVPIDPNWKTDLAYDVVIVWAKDSQTVDRLHSDIQGMGMMVLADYASSVLVRVQNFDKESLKAYGYDIRELPDRTVTGRGNYYFDSRLGDGSIPEHMRVNLRANPNYNLFIVQFVGPATSEWFDAIQMAGASVIEYLPHYSYLVEIDGQSAESVALMPFVQWVGVYHPAYKLGVDLDNGDPQNPREAS
jgi:hypothetical protein